MREHQLTKFAEDFIFLEGLRWRGGHLWISDMLDCAVYRLAPDGSRKVVCAVPSRPSGIGFLPDGTPLVVSMVDRKVYKIIDGGLAVHADLAMIATGDLNDMLVDDLGRAYAGNFGYDLFGGAEAKLANVAMISADGTSRMVADDLNFPNGIALVDGGRTLVVAETWGNCLTAFDVASDGTLSGRKVYADLGERTPDGICADREDGIWVSSFVTGEFVRVARGGEITDRIFAEGKRAVSCTLGGSNGRTLFCSTFAGHLEEMVARKRAGAIEAVVVDIPGRALS